MLEAIALLNSKISFSLRNDATGKMALQTRKSDSVQGSFTALFGLDKSRHLVEVQAEEKPFRFTGVVRFLR